MGEAKTADQIEAKVQVHALSPLLLYIFKNNVDSLPIRIYNKRMSYKTENREEKAVQIRKILILFAALMSLTAAALADLPYTQYTQAEVEQFVYHMPKGLVYTEVRPAQDGHAEIVVDSAQSNWTYIAAQAALLEGVEFTFNVPMIAGAAHSKSGAIFVDSEYYATLDDAMVELDGFVSGQGYDRESPGGWGMLADVSNETSTIIPTVYDQNKPMLVMTQYYDDSDNLLDTKYATLYITYTDASAQRVEFAGVPAGRLSNTTSLTDVGEVSISEGLVNYEMNAGFGGQISLTVTPPAGTKRYSVKNGGSIGLGNGVSECNGDLQLSIGVSSSNESYTRRSVAFIWLDDQGNVIDVESLAINVSVGDPKPWINYIDEADLSLLDENSFVAGFEGAQELQGIGQTYKDGTITVAPTQENFSVSGTPDQLCLAVYLNAPDGAKTYKHASYDEANVLGEQHNTYKNYLQYVQQDKAHDVPGDGKVRIGELPVFECAEYQNNPGLKVYYDANPTDRANGHVIMVEWYGESGNLLQRQALIVQFETMAMEVKTIVEAVVPDAVQNPTLIAENASSSSGYALQVMSYPQTGEAQRHYELRLLDSNGDAQPVSALKSDVQLLIPYPDGTNQNSEEQFAINHYTADEPPKVQEVFSEAKGNLIRTEAGLLLTVKSLSPFVISWEKPGHELVYTASGNTLTQRCERCGHSATATLEIKSDFAKGEKVSAVVDVSAEWLGDKPAIFYASKDGQALASVPTASGSYSVSMTMGNAKVTCYFTIADPEILPQTGDDSLPLTVLFTVMLMSVAGVIWLGRKRRIN